MTPASVVDVKEILPAAARPFEFGHSAVGDASDGTNPEKVRYPE
jgi:hypothetical protein